jgi:mRNA-degrading endonuclease RelE of RelBE toxin-antitoxin system
LEPIPVTFPPYRVLWHQNIKDDFDGIPRALTDNIVRNADHRLSQAPTLIGKPLKGTTHLLWRLAYSQYRIIYTLNEKAGEVWVLSVQKRSDVYHEQHLQYLLKLAQTLKR